MDSVCKSFGIENNIHCSNWFYQANEHCHEMLYPLDRKATLWDMLQEIIFDDQIFGVYDPNFMNRLPTYLTSIECSNLYKNLSSDYMRNVVPRNNRLILQSWIMFYIILALVSTYVAYEIYYLLKCIVLGFVKHKQNITKLSGNDVITDREKKAYYLNSRSLNTMKYETKHLSFKSEITEQSFCCPNHNNLVLKVSKKLSFVNSLVYGFNETIGRFYNLRDLSVENGKRSIYTSATTVDKVLQYINKFKSRPLQMWIIFDDEEEYIISSEENYYETSSAFSNQKEEKKQTNELANGQTYTTISTQSKIPSLPKVLSKVRPKYSKADSADDLRPKKSMNSLSMTQRPSQKSIESERQTKLKLKQKRSENNIKTVKPNQLNTRNGKKPF